MNNPASNQLLYQIALTRLPKVGSVMAKNLLTYYGSAEEIFRGSKMKLEEFPFLEREKTSFLTNPEALNAALNEAEQELKFIEEYKIKPLYFTQDDYPQRLKNCNDAPLLLYYKGNGDLNTSKVIGIVGTRGISNYGKEITKELIRDISNHHILVVSGLALGVDTVAHKASLENKLNTVGVLGHGLKTIYPAQNKELAATMVSNGGLLTEFVSTEFSDPRNFPRRNRVVAGLCDALVVVESAIDGGGLITANIANSYNRDVFAFPGKASDRMSAGCNFLIKTNKAALIENAQDLLNAMMWNDEKEKKSSKAPRQLSLTLSPDEQKLYELLREKQEAEIDLLLSISGMTSGQLAGVLLEMEMNGLVVSLPGKRYKLI